MKDQRFTGTLLDGIPYPGTYRLHFGWISSPEFKNENGKRIVCRFDVADVESGLEIIDRWDLYGSGVHGEHSDTCPSRGVRGVMWRIPRVKSLIRARIGSGLGRCGHG